MIDRISKWIKKRKEIKLITHISKLANEKIYSERYILNNEKDKMLLLNEVINSNNSIDIIRGYLTINYTTYRQSPINEIDAEKIIQELEEIEIKLKPNNEKLRIIEVGLEKDKTNSLISENNLNLKKMLEELDLLKLEMAKHIISVEKAKLDVNLMVTQAYLDTGKKAYLENEYSYRGGIYSLEKALRGPSTLQDRAELKIQAEKLIALENELEENAKRNNK